MPADRIVAILTTLRRPALTALVCALLGPPGTARAQALAPTPGPEPARLKAHVQTLASPEFEGRRGPGAAKAARYVLDAFQQLDLEPLFEGSFVQTIPGKARGSVLGQNIGGILRGSDPELRDEYIVVGAHFDHLGVRNGVLYPGADDNATAVAMMLEMARSLATAPERPRRSLIFLGFDLEEEGLWGSRYFADHPPIPLERVKLFLTADMMGRALGGVCERHVFAMGTEHAPSLAPWIAEGARDEPIRLAIVGSDLLLIDRSDYGPFRQRKIPYLFFSTGENPCYHQPTDVAATIDYPKFEATCRVIHRVITRAAGAPTLPGWSPTLEPPATEAEAIGEVLEILQAHADQLGMSPLVRRVVANQIEAIRGIRARGTIAASERSSLVRAAQLVLFSVL